MTDDQPNPEEVDAIANALADGRKIEAIRIYRDVTGKGLKEAKEFIDELIPGLAEKDPERFGQLAANSGKGCAGTAMLFLLVALSGLGAAIMS